MPVGALVGEFFGKTGHIKEGLAIAFPPPAIFGLGTAGGFEFYLQNRGEGGPKRLYEVTQQFIGAASQSPKLGLVKRFWRANVPQLYVDVDREKAKSLGVPLEDIFGTLAATLGQLLRQRLQQVRPHLAGAHVGGAGQRSSPGRRRQAVYVRSENNEMIPLRSLARIEYSERPGTHRPLQQPAGGEGASAAASPA